jgi:hypothetical protein
LSANKGGKSGGAGKRGSEGPPKNPKKPRAGDLGRALRSVYDDTLRETVPDDFLDLIGKLS